MHAGSTQSPRTLSFVAGETRVDVYDLYGRRVLHLIRLQTLRQSSRTSASQTLQRDKDPSSPSYFHFTPPPLILSEKDGRGEDEGRVSGSRCPEEAGAHVGQSDLRVEAAGQGGV